MTKIHDNVDIKGKMTGNIESDNTHFKDATDDTKVLKLNQQGQTAAQMVTLYSFENGAFVVEPETPNLQNVTEGYVFFWIPNLPNTFQVTANHSPTSWALVNAPAGVTIDQNGLISWDGTGAVSTGTVTIQATNIFGTSNTDVTMTITSGFEGSPSLVVDTLQISGAGFNEGDTVQTWQDSSGNGHDFTQATLADRPTIKIDAFASGVNGLRFDGASQFMTTTSLSNQIYTTGSGNSGEVYVVFRFDGLSVNSPTPIYWSNKTSTLYHIIITYRSENGGYLQFAGGDAEVKEFAFSPVVNQTYVVRFAWSANNYFEVQFEGQTAQQQVITSAPTVASATSYQVIAGADESTDATAYNGLRPLYADITYGAIVCYSTLLDAQQIQANFDYINSLWNPA